jgi:hypothetical protein
MPRVSPKTRYKRIEKKITEAIYQIKRGSIKKPIKQRNFKHE